MKKTKLSISKILKSEINSVRAVEPLLNKIREHLNIPDERFYNLLIAVTEAVNNAIVHGNLRDTSRNVYLSIKLENNTVLVEVEDEGNGFDPDSVADPREPENLLKTSGRGIFLIKSLMTESKFSFTEKGTKVSMKFEL